MPDDWKPPIASSTGKPCELCARYGHGCQFHPDDENSPNVDSHRTHRGEGARMTARQSEALDLRIQGHTYRRIAAELEVSLSVAYNDVQVALQQTADLRKQRAEKLRELEEERLDELLQKLAENMDQRIEVECPKCEEPVFVVLPSLQAIGEARRVSESRRKLLGLDAPERHIHELVERLEREVWPRWTEALREAGVSDDQLQAASEVLQDGTVH